MNFEIVQGGASRSFPAGDEFLSESQVGARVVIYLNAVMLPDETRDAVLVELSTECLGVHTGENYGCEGDNRLGFARYTNGSDHPSSLIELVRQPNTSQTAIAAARAVFESRGFTVVVCSDQMGRIIDRLVRPKYNAALTFLDEGLATAADMDLTCAMGLGYPDGPIDRVERGGLAYHYDVSKALFDASGLAGYAPARRAVVAHQRRHTPSDPTDNS